MKPTKQEAQKTFKANRNNLRDKFKQIYVEPVDVDTFERLEDSITETLGKHGLPVELSFSLSDRSEKGLDAEILKTADILRKVKQVFNLPESTELKSYFNFEESNHEDNVHTFDFVQNIKDLKLCNRTQALVDDGIDVIQVFVISEFKKNELVTVDANGLQMRASFDGIVARALDFNHSNSDEFEVILDKHVQIINIDQVTFLN